MAHFTATQAKIKVAHFLSTFKHINNTHTLFTQQGLFCLKMADFGTNNHLFLSLLFVVSFCFSHIHSSIYNQEELQWLDDKDDEISMIQGRHSSLRSCDFTKGKWVYDQTYPLYDANCPYLSSAVTCHKNERPDSDYEKWRWKPDGCSIPRYIGLTNVAFVTS